MLDRWKLSVVPCAVGAALILSGCPGVTPPNIKSDDKSMQGLAGGEGCNEADLLGKQSPYIVNAGDDVRADLESAMDEGVVIVRYGCDKIEIMDDCRLNGGSYGYSKITQKTKVLEMKDAASAQANLGGSIAGDLSAEFEMGRSLYVQYAWVGKKKTTVRTVQRAELAGSECGEATHFVRGADLGAFVMQTASSAEVGAKVDFFGEGGGTESSSSNSTRVTDGDHTRCSNNVEGKPPAGCSALIRLSLTPIEDGAKGQAVARKERGTEAEVGCREGYVINNDGICVSAQDAETFMCEEGNFEQCNAQCGKGSIQSCGRLANLLMKSVDDPELEATFFGGAEDAEAQLFAMLANYADNFALACDEGEADACTMAGFGIMAPLMQSAEPDLALMGPAVAMLERGCSGGESFSCTLLADLFLGTEAEVQAVMGIKGGPVRYFSLLESGCNSGNGQACLTLSEEYVIGEHLKTNGEKAAALAEQACYGGLAMSCMMSAGLQLGEELCNENMKELAQEASGEESERARLVRERICAVAGELEIDEDNPAAVRPIIVRAVDFLQRACDLGQTKACEDAEEGRQMLLEIDGQ